jgi:alpha-L-fucosidase
MPRQRSFIGVLVALTALLVSMTISAPARAELQNPRQDWLRASTAGLFLHWGMRTSPGYTDVAAWEKAIADGGWSADYWVNEAQKLHASYIVLASFHSKMGYVRTWPSKIPGSPTTKRDYLRELIDAAKAKGLKVILYVTDDPQWHNETGYDYLNSAAYSAYKGKSVDITTRDGFGQFSADNINEVEQNYPDLAGLWIDNLNKYWMTNHVFDDLRTKRPSWLLSNNNEDTPLFDTVSNEQKSGMTPYYDYPSATWSPAPRLTEGNYTPSGGYYYTGSDPAIDNNLALDRYITMAGSSIKALVGEGPTTSGQFPANIAAFNNFMKSYLDPIWSSLGNTEGGGYMYGGLQPGPVNSGGYAVTTVSRANPDLHFVHVTTKPSSGTSLTIRDNGYRITRVSDVRTGKVLSFTQSNGALTINGVSAWDPYDTVFRVETAGRQGIYASSSVKASASVGTASTLADGSYLTSWSNGGTLPVSTTLDLGSAKPLAYLGINQREWSVAYHRSSTEDSARIKDYTVAVSTNGSTWTTVKSAQMRSSRGVHFIDLKVASARYVRLTVSTTWAASTATKFFKQLQVDELWVGGSYATPAPPSTTYEAEAAGNTFGGKAVAAACASCSNGNNVKFVGNGAANTVTFNGVTATTAGNHSVVIRALVSGTRNFTISVNGGAPVTVAVTGSSFSTVTTATVNLPLAAGSNKLTFGNSSAYAPDLDAITVS